MKKEHIFISLTALFFVTLFGSNIGSAQETWREKIKEKIKERRSRRIDRKRQFIAKPGDFDLSLIHDGLKRTYQVHVPPANKRTTPAPLIFAFHGGGGSSETMANDRSYNLKSKSDKEGFIIVFPNGSSKLRSGKFATWNAGRCCAYARDENIDDIGFVKAMINDLDQKLNIDKNRIYALGFSNGGMLAYRLACEMPDVFKAIASVAGTENYDHCDPVEPISILHIHAKDDGHVLFEGGAGEEAFRDLSKVTDFTSVPETVSRWVKRDRCDNSAQRVLDKDGAYCDLYTGCMDNSSVQLCATEEGGHSWPGGNKPRSKSGQPGDAINATDVIWEFFKKE